MGKQSFREIKSVILGSKPISYKAPLNPLPIFAKPGFSQLVAISNSQPEAEPPERQMGTQESITILIITITTRIK